MKFTLVQSGQIRLLAPRPDGIENIHTMGIESNRPEDLISTTTRGGNHLWYGELSVSTLWSLQGQSDDHRLVLRSTTSPKHR